MQLEKAQRSNLPIKMGISGGAGTGKSVSSLLVSFGLTGDWTKIAVIDTENRASHLYAHLGSFNVLDFSPPFTPERYIQAIEVCLKAKMQVIVIDSISFEWENILDSHSQMSGNSYTNWAKFTPRHQQFVQAILQADCHVICTLRSKQDYILVEKNGRQVPKKVSMKPIQREGIDYEFTLLFELDINHRAVATKDRTGLFSDKHEFVITPAVGQEILQWCNSGYQTQKLYCEPKKPVYDLVKLIQECENVEELRLLYYSVTQAEQQEFRGEFDRHKDYLSQPILSQSSFQILNQINQNGNTSLNGSTRL